MFKPATRAVLLLLAGLLSFLPAAARAEDEGMVYHEYWPADWGIMLALEDFGTIYEPGDAGWNRDDLDFWWDTDPAQEDVWVFHIEGATIRDDATGEGLVLTDDEFAAFHDEMLASYADDPLAEVLEEDPAHMAAGRQWQMINLVQTVVETDDEGNEVEIDVPCYSMVTRSDDGVLRMVNFFYELPEEDDAASIIAATIMLHLDPSLAEEVE